MRISDWSSDVCSSDLFNASEKSATRVDFSDALKASLDNVANAQNEADLLGKKFSLGDESVNLSDVMISMQKASLSFQATVQVRNKLVSAYQEMIDRKSVE